MNDIVNQVNWMNLIRLIMSICGGSVNLISGGREDDTVNNVVKQVNWMNLM